MDIKEKILKSKSCNIFSRISKNELNELIYLTSFLPINSSIRKRYFYVKNNLTSTVKCKMCDNEPSFFGKSYAIYCSSNCRKNDTKEKELKKKLIELEKSKELLIKYPDDYIKCEICGVATKSIFSHLQRHDNWTTEKYKLKYPNSLIVSKNESKRLSFNRTGEMNNNHKSKTTLEQRQSISPFSKKFKKYKNDTDRDNFLKTFDIVNPNQKRYWLNKGFSEDEAKQKISERQKTFTLEKCIAKLGEIEGTKRFNDRNSKWSAKIEEKYKNGEFSRKPKKINSTRISNMSKTVISELLKIYPDAICYENEFEIFDEEHGKWIGFDFKVGKKIIEINGDYWHCNPIKYKADYYNKNLKMTAQEKWNYDKQKIEFANSKGFEVLEVWENDIKQNKNNVINTCLQFLKDH
jgi:hypothetical protein